MKLSAIGSLASHVAVKSWGASFAVHVAALSALVSWNGLPVAPPRVNSHFGQTSLMLSAADPNPGSLELNDSKADPAVVKIELMEPAPLPIPAPEAAEMQESEVAPPVLAADTLDENPRTQLPPQVALEPVEEQQPVEAVKPPPGDDTPTSSIPSPGRMGNEQPTELAFDSNPPILYPASAVRDGIEGTVLLRIRIAVDGRVANVELVKSSGSAILDRAAMEGVRTWHGHPAQIAGHAIEAAALLPVVFRMN